MKIIVIPHNFVWGSCFWFCIPGRRLLPASRLPPSIFHSHLCHTPSFKPTFVTHHLSHTTLSHTIFHISHLPSFCVAGVAQTHICGTLRSRCGTNSHLPSFCMASTIVLRGRRSIDGTGWRAWSDLVARDAAALCMAGVAQTHIYHRFAWQAWHKLSFPNLILIFTQSARSSAAYGVATAADVGREWGLVSDWNLRRCSTQITFWSARNTINFFS